jgi:transcriptional regulator with XRE-family HTH domain
VIRLKFERVNRRISQETLAFVAQVPQPVICLIERGTWNPSPAHLALLGRALHVEPPELLLRQIEARTEFRREVAR